MSIHSTFGSLGIIGTAGLVISGMLGCAGNADYVYRPETMNATTQAGLPAARTPIPQERPQGAIELVSYGVTELRGDTAKIQVLHVRAIVMNDGDDVPWTLDTTQQLVEIPGEGRSRAMFVNSDVGTLPNATIARHERHVLDFYFPLPDTVRNASELARFDVLWQVNTPARTVASRTSFDRISVEPEVTYSDVQPWPLWAGWGPYWWYDPVYPSDVFAHSHPYVFHGHVADRRGGTAPSGRRAG